MESATCFYCSSHRFIPHSYNRVYCTDCKKRYSPKKVARLAKITEYFSLEIPAFKAARLLKLEYKTVYRRYEQLRKSIAKDVFVDLINKLPELKDQGILVNTSSSYKTTLGLAVVTINRLCFPIFFDPHHERRLTEFLKKQSITHAIILNNEQLSLKKLLKKGKNDSSSFWSQAKKSLKKFNGVTKKHLASYLFEIAYRLNHKQDNLQKLLIKFVSNEGRRMRI